jgi:hypothetical protein
MKNIYLLPTDKPSRLFIIDGKLYNYHKPQQGDGVNEINQNIYITSDEEIKEGNWCINTVESIVLTLDKKTEKAIPFESIKKIILTTDQDLIKDGVQSIDDEFLEWFVKNPSFEEVEVEWIKTPDGIFYHKDNVPYGCYKIIIPQEEPNYNMKQEILDEMKRIEKPKQETLTYTESAKKEERIFNSTMMSKQETLEEVRKVERSDLYNKIHSIVKQIPREDVETDAMDASSCAYDIEQLFYKWQAERSQKIVPSDAYNIEVFAIKPDENGKLFAYIGYKISNGNFEFNVVPFTEPQAERMYSKEEVIEFGEMIAWNMVGKTITESFIRTVSKELFEQFKKK